MGEGEDERCGHDPADHVPQAHRMPVSSSRSLCGRRCHNRNGSFSSSSFIFGRLECWISVVFARFAVNFRSRSEGKLVFTLSAEVGLQRCPSVPCEDDPLAVAATLMPQGHRSNLAVMYQAPETMIGTYMPGAQGLESPFRGLCAGGRRELRVRMGRHELQQPKRRRGSGQEDLEVDVHGPSSCSELRSCR